MDLTTRNLGPSPSPLALVLVSRARTKDLRLQIEKSVLDQFWAIDLWFEHENENEREKSDRPLVHPIRKFEYLKVNLDRYMVSTSVGSSGFDRVQRSVAIPPIS